MYLPTSCGELLKRSVPPPPSWRTMVPLAGELGSAMATVAWMLSVPGQSTARSWHAAPGGSVPPEGTVVQSTMPMAVAVPSACAPPPPVPLPPVPFPPLPLPPLPTVLDELPPLPEAAPVVADDVEVPPEPAAPSWLLPPHATNDPSAPVT